MASDRRIAITGLGVTSAAGIGIDALWDALCEKRPCVGTIEQFDASGFPSSIGGEIPEFSARKFVPKSYRKSVKVMARDIEIAVASAQLAFDDAGLTTRAAAESDDELTVAPGRMGCNIGAGLICTDLDELGRAVTTAVTDGRFDFRKWGEEGLNNLTPLWLLKYLPNMLSCHVTIIHGLEGPSNCITCGEASGQLAIGESGRYIGRGACDIAVAGGAESKVNPMGLLRQSLLKRLCESRNDRPETACRPFDADRDGTVVAEGGGLIILEEMAHAIGREAKVYATLDGFGGACDPAGLDVTTAGVGGMDLAITRALDAAGIGPDQLGAIVTHGSGSPGDDDAEAAAWRKAIGADIEQIPAVSLTGAVGQAFAGAGGMECALAAKIAKEGTVPPTVNFETPAEGCALWLGGESRPVTGEYVLTASYAVGGQSAAVVLKRATE
jgi:3-oxoacyl-[acyl-carrier-protein] synthase II